MTLRRLTLVVTLALSAAAWLGAPAPAAAQQPGSFESMAKDAHRQLELMNEFAALESQSRRRLKDGDFEEARRLARQALALNVSNRRARALMDEIDAGERAARPAREANVTPRTRPPAPVPNVEAPRVPSAPSPPPPPAVSRTPAASVPPRAAPVPAPATRGARPDEVERAALRAYLSGDYGAVVATRDAAGDAAPPRLWFYAACSEAALGLLDPTSEAEQRFERARQLFARAIASGHTFSADRRAISPRVLTVLQGATP